MIKDWNRNEVMPNEVFTFKGSTDPYIQIDTPDDFYFLNLKTTRVETYDSINFYTKENDEDFKGVDVIGTITAENNTIIFLKNS
ncbi:MAG: hypothetical protein IJI84_00245 [Clostridia bacterium]|nr:hypothetical protein [Clostridia bacterium]